MRTLLLSVRPEFAEGLINGTKTAEVRRRFSLDVVGSTAIIYASTPTRAVIGEIRIGEAVEVQREKLWEKYGQRLKIAEVDLEDYLDETETPVILEATEPERWGRPVTLAELRESTGVEPPQSYRFLTDEQAAALRKLSATV
jgi:predicted transcriptional regulator